MYDEAGRPWAPDQGWDRTYNALMGKQNMTRAAVVEAKRLSTRIPIPLLSGDPSVAGFNPSVVVSPSGELIVCLRTIATGQKRTTNKIGRIDSGRLVDLKPLRESPLATSSVFGIEDVRLFFKGQDLWGIATVAMATQTVGTPKADMVVFKIVDGVEHASPEVVETFPPGSYKPLTARCVADEKVLKSPRYERNWMPVIGSDPQRYVYSTNPLVVVGENDDVANLKVPAGTLRGSSQVVSFRGGYLAVVHEVATGAPIEYTHRFVIFDAAFAGAPKVGKPFFFQKRGIEFCAGLAVLNDAVWISYGVEDKRAYLAEVPDETLKEFLP